MLKNDRANKSRLEITININTGSILIYSLDFALIFSLTYKNALWQFFLIKNKFKSQNYAIDEKKKASLLYLIEVKSREILGNKVSS